MVSSTEMTSMYVILLAPIVQGVKELSACSTLAQLQWPTQKKNKGNTRMPRTPLTSHDNDESTRTSQRNKKQSRRHYFCKRQKQVQTWLCHRRHFCSNLEGYALAHRNWKHVMGATCATHAVNLMVKPGKAVWKINMATLFRGCSSNLEHSSQRIITERPHSCDATAAFLIQWFIQELCWDQQKRK